MNRLNPVNLTRADLVIGIPSYCAASTIGDVVHKCSQGLKTYFPDFVSVIINVDNNSPDNTKSAFMRAASGVPQIYISTPPDIRGKGSNLYNLFEEVVHLQATGAVVVPANHSSVTPECIKELASPILNGYDFAAALHEGSGDFHGLTSHLCYPMIYGLLGREIRQPLGGHLAFSQNLARYYLKQDWLPATRQHGIDIFMTTHAVLGGFECSQVGLVNQIQSRGPDYANPRFEETIETFFHALMSSKEAWLMDITPRPYPLFGQRDVSGACTTDEDLKTLTATATMDFIEQLTVLAEVLDPGVYGELTKIYTEGEITLTADLWVRTLCDLLFAYNYTENRKALIEVLRSLLRSRVSTFVQEAANRKRVAERIIRSQARRFYRQRASILQQFAYRRAVA